jgi:stress response protein YsnF
VLNRPVSPETAVIEIDDTNTLPINEEPPNLEEIRYVIKELEIGKARHRQYHNRTVKS